MIPKLTGSSVKHLLTRLVKEEDGVEVVESVLVIGLIAVVCLVAMRVVGVKINLRWSDLDSWM